MINRIGLKNMSIKKLLILLVLTSVVFLAMSSNSIANNGHVAQSGLNKEELASRPGSSEKPGGINKESVQADGAVTLSSFEELQKKIDKSKEGRSARNKALQKSGLSSDVSKLDDFEKDMLLIRARELTPDRLFEAYPNLPKEKLSKLKKLAK